MGLMVGPLGCRYQPQRGWKVRWPRGWSVVSLWLSSNKNFGHQSLWELPWLAVLHVYCHTLLPEVSTVHSSTRRGQLGVSCLEHSWTLPYVSLSLANSNLVPFTVGNCKTLYFTVINHNCENNDFQWVLWVLLVNYRTQGWSWAHSGL